jgi:endoglucanase
MKNTRFIRRFLASLFIFMGILVLYLIEYRKTSPSFAPYTLLHSSWDNYKTHFIKDGQVVDDKLKSTTSEGQSYALLRAVYIDDKDTFDTVWNWTEGNLKRNDDNLFNWKLGENTDNSASDADSDIALALLFASKRWGDKNYESDALKIIDDIWTKETIEVLDKRYLVAGNWATNSPIILNPSYFSPYAWRIFAEFDKDHNWTSLIDPAYELLNRSGIEPLDTNGGVGLPPDWVAIDTNTGELSAPSIDNYTTNYGYDALRIPFRIALDYQWFGEERAKLYLEHSFVTLQKDYSQRQKLAAEYRHDGTLIADSESPSMYATSLAVFLQTDPSTAKKIYQEKIVNLYSNGNNGFKSDVSYYEQNWLWFGAAFYNGLLTNLAK